MVLTSISPSEMPLVLFPILTARQLMKNDCTVYFKRHGGVIKYPDGKRIPFTCRHGAFVVLLNTWKTDNNEGPVFSRQGQA